DCVGEYPRNNQVPGAVQDNTVRSIAARTTQCARPDESSCAIQLGQGHVEFAGTGEVDDSWSWIEVGGSREPAGDIDVTKRTDCEAVTFVVSGAAHAARPGQIARGIELTKEYVAFTSAGQIESLLTWVKIDCAHEVTRRIYVASFINGGRACSIV